MVSPRNDDVAFPSVVTLLYHDLFNYPLSAEELHKWHTPLTCKKKYTVATRGKYYYIKGSDKLILERDSRLRYSKNKRRIAHKAVKLLHYLPSIIFVGITGSVAMNNATRESDIDLLLITKKGTLWSSRLVTYLLLWLAGFPIRRAGEKDEKDKLCLNMWLDETSLKIEHKNIYTAHELAQIVPLVNKRSAYEKLINSNRWLFSYWPNAIPKPKQGSSKTKSNFVSAFLIHLMYPVEPGARFFQQNYMRPKQSREVVAENRAFFHPFDWGARVLDDLAKRGVNLKL